VLTNSNGPGLRPHTIKPPSRIAAVPERKCRAPASAATLRYLRRAPPSGATHLQCGPAETVRSFEKRLARL
jgi:hypothetical protein